MSRGEGRGRITPETLERIKEALPVSVVVGKRLRLKRAGREWAALSPFNAEKTPSFFVNDHKQFWHCFSSGRHGNIFDFEMEVTGCDFVEAVEALAREAGIEVTREGVQRETRESQKARHDAIGAIEATQAFFVDQLHRNDEAKAYLRRRDLRRRAAGDLGIGWAPAGGRALIEHLADQGFSVQAMMDAGVAHRPEEGGSPFSFFRGRVTFPIRNRRGEVISFGARALGDEQPKYLNGRETPLFDKGRTLYNLDRARMAIARAGVVVVLEGYIDVATVVQGKMENVVATLGTAMTAEHMHLLWRIAPLIVHMGDGDKAGARAAFRTAETALPFVAGDRRLAFATPPNGMDPDDLVRSAGIEALESIVRTASSFVDCLWEWLRHDVPGHSPEDRARVEGEIPERLRPVMDPAMRRAFADELLRRAREIGRTNGARFRVEHALRRTAQVIPAREAALVLAAILHPEYAEAECEALARTEMHAPLCDQLRRQLLDAIITGGHGLDPEAHARDLAVLRSALPSPIPSFVRDADMAGFRAAIEMHQAQSNRRQMRQPKEQRENAR